MPWIVGMENYRAGFNGTATEEQIEITDAVAWAKDKLNFEAGAAQAQILAAGVTQGILNCPAIWVSPPHPPSRAVHHACFNSESVGLGASPSLRQSAEFLKKR